MHTSLFVLALMVPSAAPTEDATPALKWQDSYRTAQKVGREQDKPLAVFIGSGPMAAKNFVDEGSLSETSRKALADGYVCVYIDRDQAAGQRLAEQFDTPTGSAVVFSTRDGMGQAFYHAGKMSTAQFQTRVSKYAGAEVASTTETLIDSRTSFSYDPATAGSSMMRGATGAPTMTGGYPGNYGSSGGYGTSGGSRGGSRGGCSKCRR